MKIMCFLLLTITIDGDQLISRPFVDEALSRQLRATAEECKHECRSYSCFPGDAALTLKDGSKVLMQNLKAGDRIKTVSGGQVIYTEVKTFLKRDPNILEYAYITISTSEGHSLTLTPRHVVFSSSSNNTDDMEPRFAVLVKVGDYIFSQGQWDEALNPSRVTQMKSVTKTGSYVPLTEHGTLVVNDIYTSCYDSINHYIAHFFMSPFRWFPSLLDSHQDGSFSPLIKLIKTLGHAVLPSYVQLSRSELEELLKKKSEL